MRNTSGRDLVAAALVASLGLATTGSHAQDTETRTGTLSFTHDFLPPVHPMSECNIQTNH